jgi:hypothetical protein
MTGPLTQKGYFSIGTYSTAERFLPLDSPQFSLQKLGPFGNAKIQIGHQKSQNSVKMVSGDDRTMTSKSLFLDKDLFNLKAVFTIGFPVVSSTKVRSVWDNTKSGKF